MWGGMDGYGWTWGWGMGMIHMVLWWVLIVLGIIVLVRLLSRDSRSSSPPPTPGVETALEILMKRYARGEIGKEEFEEKKRDLA